MTRQTMLFAHRVVAVIALVHASTSLAAENTDFDHESVVVSENLSFEQVFASALDNAPEMLASSSRQEQAASYSRIGDSLFPGRPTLQTSYYGDQPFDSLGLREIEAGLQFDLWRPGERSAARELGRHYDALFQAWQSNLQLEVAGQVRSSFNEIQRAVALLALEQEAMTAAEELVRLTTALFTAGEVAELDVLHAQTLSLEQQQSLYTAETALIEAEHNYRAVTGLFLRPAQEFSEELSGEQTVGLDHPLLTMLRANIDVARSRVDRVRRQSGSSPSLSFGVRRERGSSLEPSMDSLGIGFSIPIGRSPSVAANVSDARRQQSDLEVALRRSYIELEKRLRDVDHEIVLSRQQLGVREAQENLSQQRWDMARSAYEVGETDLLQVVTAMREFLSTRQERVGLEFRLQQLTSDYNQSLGLLP